MKRLVLFHYHFLPGGVTTVVRNILWAAGGIEEALLCCDTRMGTSGLASAPGMPPFHFYHLPEMGYRRRGAYDRASFQREKKEILKALRKMEGPETLFWAHNHHLGKNPAFTAALSEYARNGESPLLLQIHDFPECGRWENYAFLEEYTQEWYPRGDKVWYAVINRRDQRILMESGIPRERLFYLPNTVFPDEESEERPVSRPEARKAVRDYCLKSGFPFDDKAPLLAYPVRTIRRKNIIEAFLIAFMARCNIVVTLPANSAPERPYEKVVEGLSREPFFRGAWALSRDFPDSFPMVLKAADLVLSSSVMEGFGLFFLEAKMRGANFVARALDVLDDFPGLDREGVYDTLDVPAAFVERQALTAQYLRQIERLPLPEEYSRGLKEKTVLGLSSGMIDFASLDVPRQAAILKESAAREGVREAGQSLVRKIFTLAGAYQGQGMELTPFSFRAHKERVAALLEKVSGGGGGGNHWDIDRGDVLSRFLSPDRIRLLLDYKGEER
ncbi:hypothetical protein JXR74_05785 [Candidatus Mcinerneyibacteriota bacterium]|nr:hypothetical protein [Candidatus Mcinerneyibacteriota bacterium]